MIKKILAFVFVLSLATFSGCGEKEVEKPDKPSPFPLSGKVLAIVKGTNIQAEIQTDTGKATIKISDKAKVVYNGKTVTTDTIAKDQTVYVESSDDNLADNIVITDWPGQLPMGQKVTMSAESALATTIDYIQKNHEDSGIPGKNTWHVSGKDSQVTKLEMMRTYVSGAYTLRLTWVKDSDVSEFDIMLLKAGSDLAVWSGRIRKDGKVIEERYEKR